MKKVKIPEKALKHNSFFKEHLLSDLHNWGIDNRILDQDIVNAQVESLEERLLANKCKRYNDLFSRLYECQYAIYRNLHEVVRKKAFIKGKIKVKENKELLAHHELEVSLNRERVRQLKEEIADEIKRF